MKVLSIKQPWASLIAHGIKNIENRSWRTNFRGRVMIHVSSPKKFKIDFTDDQARLAIPVIKTVLEGTMPFGAIIGEVDIIDCVINHESIWAEKSEPELWDELGDPIYDKLIYNWVLANPVLYDEPILNVKGKLSFWEFDKPENL